MNLIDILLGTVKNPILYSIIFFIYVVLAAVILPIPVEIGLFNYYINPILLVIILALGKGVGSLIAFEIGSKVRDIFKGKSFGSKLTKKIIDWCERFVIKYGYIGLLIIMSIPLMIDSATLYLFSLLNAKEDGKRAMTRVSFVGINIIAGAIRGTIILLIAFFFEIRLV
jgi:membrane protein YqaA with SNARE-associated domain